MPSLRKKALTFALVGALSTWSSGLNAPGPDTSTTTKSPALVELLGRAYVPSYQRTLEEVIMSAVPDFYRQTSLAASLPPYTRILLLSPASFASYTRDRIGEAGLDSNKFVFLTYDNKEFIASDWAQDLGEVVQTGAKRRLILPYTTGLKESDTDSLKAFLESEGLPAEKSSLWFSGGNVVYDRYQGKNILFVGQDVLSFNGWEEMDERYRQLLLERFKREFSADTLIPLGKDQYATQMFHIDQSFLITGPGEAVVLDPSVISKQDIEDLATKLQAVYQDPKNALFTTLPEEEQDFLYRKVGHLDEDGVMDLFLRSAESLIDIREKLLSLGYKVHSFPLDLWQNFHYQSYLNAVPFIDKRDQRKSLLLPLFPDDDGMYLPYGQNNREAKEFFEDLGFKVIPVRNTTWSQGGNVHCLLNEYR